MNKTGMQVWNERDVPASLSEFMQEHGLQWNANVHYWDLGCDGDWALITGTVSGYNLGDFVEGLIKGAGNTLHPVCTLSCEGGLIVRGSASTK